MYLAAGAAHYAPISWDEAFRLVADRLRELPDPNRAVFYTSGRASNEAAFLYQLLARRLGTNNLPDCSNMCHESSGAALSQTIGIGKGTVTLEDISDHAELIVVVGQNPGTNHPRMLTALEEAKRRGAKIVAINPLPEAGLMRFKNPQKARGLGHGTKLTDRFLQVRLNGDLALFAGVNKALLERDDAAPGSVLDHAFIAAYTDGFDAAAAAWRDLDWASVEEPAGCPGSRSRRRRRRDRRGQRHRLLGHGPDPAQERGRDDPRGRELPAAPGQHRPAGRGAVPGARAQQRAGRPDDGHLGEDARRLPRQAARRVRLRAAAGARLRRRRRHQGHARRQGRGVLRAGRQLRRRHARHRGDRGRARRCGLTVQVSTKLNRSHLVTGREALILPCLGRTERDVREGARTGAEQFVTVEDSMSVVKPPGGGSRPRPRSCAARSRSSPAWRRSCSTTTSAGPRWARTTR